MLQPCYINGLEKKGFEVLGIPLAPLTLYHMRCLYAADSPFVVESEGVTVEGLVQAALICTHPTRRELDAFMSRAFGDAILNFVLSLPEDTDYTKECKVFQEYIEHYTESPARLSPQQTADTLHAPWWGMTKSFLCAEAGYTNEEAWDCVVCEAFAEMAWSGARNGDKSLVSEYAFLLKKKYEAGEMKPMSQDEIRAAMKGETPNG